MWFKVMMSMSVSTGGGYSACATTCSTTDAATLATCRFYRWERFLSTLSARPRRHVPRGGAAAAGARHSTTFFILLLFFYLSYFFLNYVFCHKSFPDCNEASSNRWWAGLGKGPKLISQVSNLRYSLSSRYAVVHIVN